MTGLATFKAIPLLDKSAVVFAGSRFRATIPVADLPSWVALYRRLRDREGGKFARFYVQQAEALESAAKTLGIPVPDLRAKPKAKK